MRGWEPQRKGVNAGHIRKCGPPSLRTAQRSNAAKASLPSPGGFLLHDRDVSVGLVRNHLPAARQAGQNRGFGSALGEKHETMAFVSLGSAPIRMVHDCAFAPASVREMSFSQKQVRTARKWVYNETWI